LSNLYKIGKYDKEIGEKIGKIINKIGKKPELSPRLSNLYKIGKYDKEIGEKIGKLSTKSGKTGTFTQSVLTLHLVLSRSERHLNKKKGFSLLKV